MIQYIFQSDWFLYNLSFYVGVMDLYNLKLVSKMTWKNMIVRGGDIKNIIIKQIHIRLKNILRDQYDLFIRYIKINQIAISGSFMMQCILGEDWANSDIDLYLCDEENDNYFDIMGIDKEVLTYEQKQEITDSYGHFIDINKIINRKVYGKRIQTIYVGENVINTHEEFKNFVMNTFDLNICKNIFQIIDGKEMVYVHDLMGLIRKREVVDGNYIREKKWGRIEKYIGRGFDIRGELTIDKYFKYSVNSMPFLVFKNDKDGKFEKLTFLDKVMNRDDIIKCLEERDGNIIINIDVDKCEKIRDRWLFGIYLKDIFKMFLGRECFEDGKCNCHVDILCGIRHKHYKMEVCEIHNNSRGFCQFLVVNYDDLGNVMRDEYNKIFDMDCGIEDKHIEIEHDSVHHKFWDRYWDMFDLGDVMIKDDDEYNILEEIDVKVGTYNDEHRARSFERGPVKGRYYNAEYGFDYDYRIGPKWYDMKRKMLKDFGDDDLINIRGLTYKKKEFIVSNLGYLDMGVCYEVMRVLGD